MNPLGFRPLGAVFGTAVFPAFDAHRIERATHDVVAYSRQILDSAAPNENDRVLLEIVTDARNVGRHLDAIGQPDTGHLPQSRVRLFRCRDEDPDANPSLLGAALERRRVRLRSRSLPSFSDQLTKSRQNGYLFSIELPHSENKILNPQGKWDSGQPAESSN